MMEWSTSARTAAWLAVSLVGIGGIAAATGGRSGLSQGLTAEHPMVATAARIEAAPGRDGATAESGGSAAAPGSQDGPLFYDGFESGDWSKSENGISRSDGNGGNCSSYVSDTFPAFAGRHVHVMHHKAGTGGTNCEFRVKLNGSGGAYGNGRQGLPNEIMVEYQLFWPANFKLRGRGMSNHKFFRVWSEGSTDGQFSVTNEFRAEFASGDSTIAGSRTIAEVEPTYNQGLSREYLQADPYIAADSGAIRVGEWNKIQVCVRADRTNRNSFFRLVANDTLAARTEDRVFWTRNDTAEVTWLTGFYLMGAGASYLDDTVWLLDELKVYADADLCPTNPAHDGLE